MDGDVLGAVIGRPASVVRRQGALLQGYRHVYRQGATYPILMIFMSGPEVIASSEEWTLTKWIRRHKREYLRRIRYERGRFAYTEGY